MICNRELSSAFSSGHYYELKLFLLAGPWDTSSCTYTVPGLYGYVRSQPPNMPEIPPVKQAVEDPIAHVAGSAVSRKASKRGRPKKLAASVDASPSLDKPQLQAQARKSEPCKVQPEARAHIFEEFVLNKWKTCAEYEFGNLQQVEKFIPGWSFMNGEDASNEFVGLAALSKDKNEEEMRDDAWERGEGPTVDEVDDKNSAQLGQRFVYVIKVCPRFCRRADFTCIHGGYYFCQHQLSGRGQAIALIGKQPPV
ncbi:hypothetical protein NC653_018312 [Populus alba x Populus x berolinensis]|uniref:Uncharacterized protein n=1 Tax=Populus alba x Populus x berolinensis TaxID=444605 RepID=A0AAD6QG46_9ROSI|nr:hypothetical protein NC653_018312 [Populus alba x Populus x berolinensis]